MHLCFRNHRTGAFSLAEVLVAITVAVIFGAAAFATNARLMGMLKSQREMTAATMMLQERMEAFRSLAYSGVGSNVASATSSPPTTAADIVKNTTISEGQLGGISGSLKETITVSGYMDKSGNCPSSPSQNQWVRSAASPTGDSSGATIADLTTSYDLLKVDVQLNWIGADGRTRNREYAAVIGLGIIGQ